jgi:uncharacterized membrane protein YbhN (UPF0104 family)
MKLVLRALVSAGVLAGLLLLLPWDDIRGSAARLPLHVWLGVYVVFVLAHQLGAIKWQTLVRAGRARFQAVDAIRCYSAGLFANLCLPSIVGGDVLRAGLAVKSTGRFAATVLGSIADRTLDVLSLALLITVGAVLARGNLDGAARTAVELVLVGGVVGSAVVALLAFRTPLRRWPRRIRRPVSRALVALRRLVRHPWALVTALALSLVIQTTFVLVNAWIGRSIGIAAPLQAWFLVWPLAKLSGLLPISLGGLGVRDAALASLLAPWGVPLARGVVAGLIWQTVLIAGGLSGGAIWWLLSRRSGLAASVREAEMRPAGPAVVGGEHV